MSEPGLLAQGQAAPGQSLWERAPGWRRLTVGASLLTLAAVAIPVLVPQPSEFVGPPQVLQRASAPTPASAPASASALAQPAHPAIQNVIAPPAIAPPANTVPLPAQAVAPANPAASCSLAMSPQVLPMGAGIVAGFENPQTSLARVRANERAFGAPINPLFASTPRAIVRIDGSGEMEAVPLPPGMTVHPGDHIAFNGPHRDGAACAYIPRLLSSDDGPAQPAATPRANAPVEALPPPAAQPGAGSSAAPADLPAGTVLVPAGVLTKVNQHNRGRGQVNFPVTITMLTPPAHGTVTTQQTSAPQRDVNGVVRIAPVTQVFYQSAPGYSGMDSFTYQRTSTDPNDPLNGPRITANIDVVAHGTGPAPGTPASATPATPQIALASPPPPNPAASSAEAPVPAQQIVAPTLTAIQPVNPVSSTPGGPVILAISAGLGTGNSILPQFHFIAPNGNAVLLHREIVQSTSSNVNFNPTSPIIVPADAQKRGAVQQGGWGCGSEQYRTTVKAWITDANGGRSNDIQYTIHCNGG